MMATCGIAGTITPRYVVDIEESVYLQEEPAESNEVQYPNVSVLEGDATAPLLQAAGPPYLCR